MQTARAGGRGETGMNNWYYAKNNQQLGPVPEDELRRLLSTGALSPNDLVWREGMANWLPASSVPELVPQGGASGGGPSQFAGAQQQGVPQYGGYPQQPVGQPQPLPYGHYGYAPGTPPPPNYLVQAILVTLFCCLPMGIVAIVFSSQVNGKHSAGDVAGALEASNKARFWAWMSFWFGFIPSLLYLVIMIVAGVADAGR